MGYIPGMQLHAIKSEKDINTANVVGILLLFYFLYLFAFCLFTLFALITK